MKISFIIPAHNEEVWIGCSVSAIREAMREVGQGYEVIVVDDASTDATAAVAGQHAARVIQVNNRQIAATRNAGAKQSQGDVLFFVDADTLANAGAIRGALKALEGGAIGGGCVFRFDGVSPLWARAIFPVAVGVERLLKLVGGCFLFCTREAFKNTGGFCERYYAAEEMLFIRALKREGRFAVPRETVVTSGRKLRTFSIWRMLRDLFRIAFRGSRALQNREGLEIWYGERKKDPLSP